jgi:hypothetical protein
LQLQGLALDLTQARAEVWAPKGLHCFCTRDSFIGSYEFTRSQVLRLLQIEQKSQSDTSMCTHSLSKCESALAELRASHSQAMDRLQQADHLRVRKQLELETNKGACVPAAEVQIIEVNLQTAVASEFRAVLLDFD